MTSQVLYSFFNIPIYESSTDFNGRYRLSGKSKRLISLGLQFLLFDFGALQPNSPPLGLCVPTDTAKLIGTFLSFSYKCAKTRLQGPVEMGKCARSSGFKPTYYCEVTLRNLQSQIGSVLFSKPSTTIDFKLNTPLFVSNSVNQNSSVDIVTRLWAG